VLSTLGEKHHFYSLFKIHWLLFLLICVYFYHQRIVNNSYYNITRNQLFYFYTAITLSILIKATPLDMIGNHYLFSAHILQLSIIYFIVIPLFILSFPRSFYRQILWNHRLRFAVTILSHPWLSLITFNGLLTLYLIPVVYTFLQTHLILHIICQLILFITAVFMWVVIIEPVPEMKVLGHLMRAAYIFFASLALMPIGFFFVIVQKVHFPIYFAVEGTIFPVLTVIYDQQLAGGILKITQMFSYCFALLFIVLQWGKREEAKEGTIDEENIRYVRGVVIHLDNNKR